MELESDRLRLDLKWEQMAGGGSLVVIDEAQATPEIFGRLRSTVDPAIQAAPTWHASTTQPI